MNGPTAKDRLSRSSLLEAIGMHNSTLRHAARALGAHRDAPGLRLFDSSVKGQIAFGPGAGLVVGVSIGAQTLRAVMVDANGWQYYDEESDLCPGQLSVEPQVLLERIRDIVGAVVEKAFADQDRLVDGALPLLGWSVAWPSLIDRERKPVGRSLSHDGWHSGQPLDQRVRNALPVPGLTTYAVPDAHAAAIAVAYDECHQEAHAQWKHAYLTLVVRLAGNVSGAVIVVEPDDKDSGDTARSGFIDSILLAGIDNHAGQIGHAPVRAGLIAELDANPVDELPPLAAQPCTCTPSSGEVPRHLESFASVLAVTQRLHPELERQEALLKVLDNQTSEPYAKALGDVGAIVGDTLLGPVAALNPAQIVLTGSLALPAVEREVRARLEAAHRFGSVPNVVSRTGTDNDLIRARGAALAVIRKELFKKLETLLVEDRTADGKVDSLTTKLPKNPFPPRG